MGSDREIPFDERIAAVLRPLKRLRYGCALCCENRSVFQRD